MPLKPPHLKPLSRDDFARAALQAAEAAGLGPMNYDPDAFALKAQDARIVIHLGNAYAEYRAAKPWKRGPILAAFVRQFQGLTQAGEPSAEQARAALRPRIREHTFFETLRLRDRVDGTRSPNIPFRVIAGGHLTLEVVLDRPDTIRSVSSEELAEWGLTFEGALSLGNANLLALGAGRFRSPRPGLFVSAWEDAYDASRLHLDEVIGGLSVAGRPVAMIPNRDTLIVTGADDAAGLTAMARLAEDALKQPRPMTGCAFRLDGGWVPFLPGEGHPAYMPLHRLALQTLAGDYEDQKALLDALHKKEGLDVFVASLMLIQEDKGKEDKGKEAGGKRGTDKAVSSVATWTEGVEALLPRADRLVFLRPRAGGEPDILGMAEWGRVEEVLGDLLEPQGLYPERYQVQSFPTAEQVDLLDLS